MADRQSTVGSRNGECPNPKGRGKREPSEIADVIHNVLFEEVEYREGRRIRRASKQELMIRKLFSAAVRGGCGSADALLKLRVHAERHGDTGPLVTGSSMIPMTTPRISGSR